MSTANASAPSSVVPQPRPVTAHPRRGLIPWILNTLPTSATIVLLGTVAWWGHNHDWKLPKFSAVAGEAAKEADDWCVEHSVPESICVECGKPKDAPSKGHGWCKVHGVAECPFEHPDMVQLTKTPIVSNEQLAAAEQALNLRPRSTNNSRCKTHERRIQAASAQTLEKTGVEIDVAFEQPVVESIVANGEVTFDQTRTAHLASRVGGTIWRVEKKLGDRVFAGDVLLLVDALEVGKAKGEFLRSLAESRLKKVAVERLTPLAGNQSVAGRQLLEADAALQESEIRLLVAQEGLVNLGLPIKTDPLLKLPIQEAAQRLKLLGIPNEVVRGLDPESLSSNLIPIKSPVDGVVVERDAVVGEVVDTTTRLFTVADISRFWVTVDIPQHEAKFVSVGQKLLFQPEDADAELAGQIDWIANAVDEKTRTLKVRAHVTSDSQRLKAFTFGTGRIVLRETAKSVVVPNDALHWEGCCHIVFVRDKDFLKDGSPKLFHVRKVRPGVKTANFTELIAGLMPGEIIATRGSESLRVELLKGNLGAG